MTWVIGARGIRQRVDVDVPLAELRHMLGGQVGLEGGPDLEQGGAEGAALVDHLLVCAVLTLIGQ